MEEMGIDICEMVVGLGGSVYMISVEYEHEHEHVDGNVFSTQYYYGI